MTSSVTWLTGWIEPCGAGRGGEGDVEPFRPEPLGQRGVGEGGAAGGDRGGDLVLQRIEGGAGGLALLWRHRAERAHREADLSLLAERGEARLLQLRFVAGGGDPTEIFFAQIVQPVHHALSSGFDAELPGRAGARKGAPAARRQTPTSVTNFTR